MKRLILVASMCLITCASYAQTTFGLKSGVNLANVTGDVGGNSMLPKFYFGGYANFQLSEKFQLQTELLYQGMGTKLDIYEVYTNDAINYTRVGEGKIRMDYISIPVLAKYYFTKGFYGEFGPQFSFAVSQKYEYDTTLKADDKFTYPAGTVDLNDAKPYKGGVSSFDLAMGVGLGYQFDSGLNIGARYNYSVNSVIDQISPKVKMNNSVVMLGVGYTFQKQDK